MEVAVSRQNHISKKGNKENAQPAHERKLIIKGEKTSVVPFQLKNDPKQQTLPKSQPLRAKAKQADTRSVSEAQKPVPAAVLSSRNALGMYKGKIVQSKIGSIWKASAGMMDPNPSAPKTENQRPGKMARRSKSAAEMQRHGTQKPAPVRSKSVSDGPAQVSKPAASSRPAAGFSSARPPARIVSATLTTAGSRNTTVAPTKAGGTHNLKTQISEPDKKVSKPPASNTISQYRFTMETAEERKAKLAEWLASKGKALKRPAMSTKPSKTKVSTKPVVKLRSQPAARHIPEPRLETDNADTSVGTVSCGDTQRAGPTASSQTPVIMNTTLDLENSDGDLSAESQDRVDDIVVNLCDALEAMETPSRCSDELTDLTDKCNSEMEDSKPIDECKAEELKIDMPEDAGKQVKDEAEESDDQKVETDDVESDDDVMETTSEMEDASVIRYSVKTTPYLQSVRKTIEGEVGTSASRRKSNINDLKFLTPVRRSSRIHNKSSQLPKMLVDHDLCVSSLAELVKLDDNPNAYIYRKNAALVADLPDESSL